MLEPCCRYNVHSRPITMSHYHAHTAGEDLDFLLEIWRNINTPKRKKRRKKHIVHDLGACLCGCSDHLWEAELLQPQLPRRLWLPPPVEGPYPKPVPANVSWRWRNPELSHATVAA